MSYQTELYSKINIQANEIIDDMPVFAKKFFNHIRDTGMSPRTKLQYAYDMRRFFDYGLMPFAQNDAKPKKPRVSTCSA